MLAAERLDFWGERRRSRGTLRAVSTIKPDRSFGAALRRSSPLLAGLATLACAGEEFRYRPPDTASGGAAGADGGAGGSSASGGAPGGAAGMGGSAGGAEGGSGGTLADCGPRSAGASPLLLYTTLDDRAAVLTPEQSEGMGSLSALGAADFVPGICGGALRIDEPGEVVRYSSANIDFGEGTLDFYYQPFSQQTDGRNHNLFGTSPYGMIDGAGLRVRKAAAGDHFQVLFVDALGDRHDLSVAPENYPFEPGTWTRVTITWDVRVGIDEQSLRVYFDGVEAVYEDAPLGVITPPSLVALDGELSIGAWSETDEAPADGLIDDFKIYSGVRPP